MVQQLLELELQLPVVVVDRNDDVDCMIATVLELVP